MDKTTITSLESMVDVDDQTTLKHILMYGQSVIRRLNTDGYDAEQRRLIVERMDDRLSRYQPIRLMFAVKRDYPDKKIPVHALHQDQTLPVLATKIVTGDFGGIHSWTNQEDRLEHVGLKLKELSFGESVAERRRLSAGVFVASLLDIDPNTVYANWM